MALKHTRARTWSWSKLYKKMFDQQEKRVDTQFSHNFETRFETFGNQLLTKGVSSREKYVAQFCFPFL